MFGISIEMQVLDALPLLLFSYRNAMRELVSAMCSTLCNCVKGGHRFCVRHTPVIHSQVENVWRQYWIPFLSQTIHKRSNARPVAHRRCADV